MRMLTSMWAALIAGLGPIQVIWEGEPAYETIHTAYPHSSPMANLLWGVWYRWDTGWYMTIAVHGYGDPVKTVIFPPLYPLLTRLVGRLLGNEYLLAGLLISNLSYGGALYLLYRLVSAEHSDSIARQSLVWLALYPGAFFFMAAYTESLFLLLVLLVFHSARQRRWLIAATAAFLATLTRLTGWVLSVPIIWEALSATGWTSWTAHVREWFRRAPQAAPGLLAALGAPLGLIAYYFYLFAAGLPSVDRAFAELWQVRINWPWISIIEAVRDLLAGPPSLVQAINLMMLATFLVLTAISVKRLRPSWWLFVLGNLGFFLLRDYPVRQLDGTLRYLTVLFPCFVTLALVIKSRRLRIGMIVCFGLLQALLLALFVRWYWVA